MFSAFGTTATLRRFCFTPDPPIFRFSLTTSIISATGVIGLLVFASSLADEELAYLHRRGFPLVLLHRAPPDSLDIPCITFENKSGARILVDHLIDVHGYRCIAFLRGPPDREESYWRELGYRESIAAHGIPFDPSLVATGGFNQDLAQIEVWRWIDEGVEIDTIFTGDDDADTGAEHFTRRV